MITKRYHLGGLHTAVVAFAFTAAATAAVTAKEGNGKPNDGPGRPQTISLSCSVRPSDASTRFDITNSTRNDIARGTTIHWNHTGVKGNNGSQSLDANLATSASITVNVATSAPASTKCTAWYSA